MLNSEIIICIVYYIIMYKNSREKNRDARERLQL